MPAPAEIKKLVENFQSHYDSYKNPSYNETQLRREFLDPFFKALGWDIDNTQGLTEAYKDVIHEDSIKIGGYAKAPDYCFRVGGRRKFFVEAKKPSINLKDDVSPAFQLRRYGWSAKLPVSILSDFEELVVYDNRLKPIKSDKASKGRVLYIRFSEYIDRWDEIASIFSKDAVLKGSFDAFAEKTKVKKGADEVDKEFLKEIEGWRETLAKDIAVNNPSLDIWQINFVVQKTIDRIIFLRICEDRGVEQYGRLMSLQNCDHVYKRLVELFERADEKYNSGLFHFKPEKNIVEPADELTQKIKISDDTLKTIFKNLYYPESPYEFSVLPSDILGQAYEQFLGKVIRLTASHRALVEEKPEVRKAGGVYYTPTYIVDYIVKNTVGKLLENKTPKQISKLRILDPACGSGSFLLGAYQYLIDWHRDYYTKDNPVELARGKNPILYRANNGEWRLTTGEKRRIILNNIYGVDIDSQAVEVTKLSLSLKVLEGENEETLNRQLRLFHERALPDLGNNIKCGNSLIGPDYFTSQLMPDPAELRRINPFDWHQEFRDIMSGGGFDAVIGNPPWGAETEKIDEIYFRTRFVVASLSIFDSYGLFMEKALNLLKIKGLLGFITPDTFLRKSELEKTREIILKESEVIELIETGPMFYQVRDTWCLVYILSKGKPVKLHKISHKQISRFVTSVEERLKIFQQGNWSVNTKSSQETWLSRPNLIVGYYPNEQSQKVITKIEKWPRLGEQKEKYKVSRGEEGSKYSIKQISAGDFRMVIPQDIERYHVSMGVPSLSNSLTQTKTELLYKHPKIWIIRIQKMRWRQRIVCAFDERKNSAGMKTLQIIISQKDNENSLKYLSAILDSRLINYWCTNYLADDINQSYLEKIPIPDSFEKADYKKLVRLADQMRQLNEKTYESNSESEHTILQRQITATDHEIDQLVYRFYDLTEKEIKIVGNDK